jgi:hypothetical protein
MAPPNLADLPDPPNLPNLPNLPDLPAPSNPLPNLSSLSDLSYPLPRARVARLSVSTWCHLGRLRCQLRPLL